MDRIYEAPTNPECWNAVLHDISCAVGAAGALIATRCPDTSWMGWRNTASFGNVGAYLTSSSAARSKATSFLISSKHNGSIADHHVFSESEYFADPMITDWAGPIGLHHCAATAIHVPTGYLVVVHVQRRSGNPVFSPSEVE